MFDCITAIDPPPSELSWAQFVQQRSALLDQALTESVITGKFADVELYAYTKRSHVGTVHTPVAVNARAGLLESASPILKAILQDRNKNGCFILAKYSEHDYDDDSDIEDEDVPGSGKNNTEPSTFEVLDSTSDYSPAEEDEDDRTGSLHSNAVFAPQAAAKTWQSLIRFLYTGRIMFLALRSCQTRSHSAASASRIACSPKSMYRLASKLQLEELKELARASIMADLSVENIAKEMFTDFAWRHPEVLKAEVAFFRKYSHAEAARDELKKAIKAAASGQMRQGEVVLVALFDNLLPSPSP
ncbi:hypothetical protein BC629DRAFT_868395 [Irpex lacteus]|nr:hypothetical protein BC629DRAFT_868395 [Irpex lacteus]